MSKAVLVINSGSSSIKYQLIDPAREKALASGLVDRIGQEIAAIEHKVGSEEYTKETSIPNHGIGLKLVIDMFKEFGPNLDEQEIIGVGHRVVQGGTIYEDAVIVDDDVAENIRELSDLAPLHNPANLMGIEVAMKLFPDVKHVAVFDSAYFRTLPESAARYAVSKDVAEKYKVRRYGAHGTSHKYVGQKVADLLGRVTKAGSIKTDFKQIVFHLGNGASASVQKGARAIDTSMGLTPLEGLVMGTRSGDIDPAVVFHLARTANMSIDEIDTELNKKSGVLGMSGVSDMRDLHALVAKGDAAAKVALEVYIHRLLHYFGAYFAIAGGVESIAFTAGIGENDDLVRLELCKKLEPFGILIDKKKNSIRSKEPRIISKDNSSVKIVVCPTNEELAIAKDVVRLVG
jgi:acetate kinase